MMEVDNNSIEKLSTLSWAIIALSLLIDISHTRAFPSYNILVGVFGSYLANQAVVPNNTESNEDEKMELEREKALLASTAAFSTLSIVSILIDVFYCICWGREIFIDGESKSAKFSMVLLIANIFLKVVALLYATALQMDSSEQYASKSHNRSFTPGSESGMERDNNDANQNARERARRNNLKSTRDVAPLQKVEMGGGNDETIVGDIHHSTSTSDFVGTTATTPIVHRNTAGDGNILNDHNNNMPLPPFTPGLPGLVSPYPKKMNHGLSPPRPPPSE